MIDQNWTRTGGTVYAATTCGAVVLTVVLDNIAASSRYLVPNVACWVQT